MFPSSSDILQSLEEISNDLLVVRLLFHFLIFACAIALFAGWRPFNKIFGSLLALSFLSVSIVSLWYGNAFNGLVFLIFFVLLLLFSIRTTAQKIELSNKWFIIPAVVMLVFGWIYPHFLDHNFYDYFVAGPVGLIPCPTLSIVIGFTLLFNGLGSRKWSLTLAILGLFYGIFGAWKLNVLIDLFLIGGSLVLLYLALSMKEQRPSDQQNSIMPTFN